MTGKAAAKPAPAAAWSHNLCLAQVGKSGQVWGIDCKKRAIALARKSVATLEAGEGPYGQLAGPVNLRQHNVFLPAGFMMVCAIRLGSLHDSVSV